MTICAPAYCMPPCSVFANPQANELTGGFCTAACHQGSIQQGVDKLKPAQQLAHTCLSTTCSQAFRFCTVQLSSLHTAPPSSPARFMETLMLLGFFELEFPQPQCYHCASCCFPSSAFQQGTSSGSRQTICTSATPDHEDIQLELPTPTMPTDRLAMLLSHSRGSALTCRWVNASRVLQHARCL